MKLMMCAALGVYFYFCSNAIYAEWEWVVLPRSYTTAGSFEQAVEIAKARDISVIVYYTRRDCPPCRVLQSHLRSQAMRQVFAPNYVFTVVWGNGMNSRKREWYRTQYRVIGAPTWIVYNSQGDYLCTAHGGFAKPKAGLLLHQRLQPALALDKSPSQLEPRTCSAL